MAEFRLTDQEIGFISMMLVKVDPAQMMAEAQNILAKIRQYAQEKQAEQVQVASEASVDDAVGV